MVAAVQRLGPPEVRREGNRLIVAVVDPARENPAIVEAIVRAGGRIQDVSELRPSLEEAYLRLVKEDA